MTKVHQRMQNYARVYQGTNKDRIIKYTKVHERTGLHKSTSKDAKLCQSLSKYKHGQDYKSATKYVKMQNMISKVSRAQEYL